ncbi:immunity protein TriTu family protein [Serratia marcescens]|uniref:immunity protein TriTu family protein n=1 Tax=Serratia marcescens TaxID=615 RepID=UPI0040330243
MLKKISDWILSNSHYEVKYNANDFTDSLVVDIDDDTKIARFTVWDDASCKILKLIISHWSIFQI